MLYTATIKFEFLGQLEYAAADEITGRLLLAGDLGKISAEYQTFSGIFLNAAEILTRIAEIVEDPGPTFRFKTVFNFDGEVIADAPDEHAARSLFASLEAELLDVVQVWPITELSELEVSASLHNID